MQKKYEIAGSVMGFFDSFKGSAPAIDNDKILIVLKMEDIMNKPKVCIIFTGGTISMTVDEEIGAAIPTLSGEQILSMVSNIDKIADIEVCNFGEIPGQIGRAHV